MTDQVQTAAASSLPPCGYYGSNYAVFRWSGSEWLLAQNCCLYGYAPMLPDGRGDYSEELQVTLCVPMVWQAEHA